MITENAENAGMNSTGPQVVSSGSEGQGQGQSVTLGRFLRPFDVARSQCETLGCGRAATVTVRWQERGGMRGGEWLHCVECATRVLYCVSGRGQRWQGQDALGGATVDEPLGTTIGHYLNARDRARIHCATDGCDEQASVCLYNRWQVGGRRGMSFWYHCAGCAGRILYGSGATRQGQGQGQGQDALGGAR